MIKSATISLFGTSKIAFITTVTLGGGPREVAILCDMHSLMPVKFFMFLSMNDFLPRCLFAVVVIKCFMIGVNV